MAPQSFKVVVTGFGPFRDHKVNASQVAVQHIKDTGGLGPSIELKTEFIEVKYTTVDELVPKLWKTHKPQLMIHVGVSGRAKLITLEDRAKNRDYITHDISGKCPPNKCCKKNGEACIKSTLNMESIAEEAKKQNLMVEISSDAGKFLCEYIYYTSLHIRRAPVAFIHVPPLNRTYTVEELSNALRDVILLMVDQVQKRR